MLEDPTTQSNQLGKHDLCTADEWEVKITKGSKGGMEDNTETRNNEVLISTNQSMEMINRYAVLVNEDGMHENGNITNVYENLSRTNNSILKSNYKHHKQVCSNTARSPNELQKRVVSRLNLQNNSKTLRQFDSKGTIESHSIPSIINGRVPRKVSTTTSYQRSTLL